MSISRFIVNLTILILTVQIYLLWATWSRTSVMMDQTQALLNDICALNQMPVGSSIKGFYDIAGFIAISNGTVYSDAIYTAACGRLEIESRKIVYTLPVRVKEKIRLRGRILLTLEKKLDGVWIKI